jgi:hypothetical protein
MARLGFTVPPHPACIPDLAHSDFHMFLKLKEELRGQYFSSDKDVKVAVRQ